MRGRGAKLASALGVLMTVLSLAGVAGAKSENAPEDKEIKITTREAEPVEAARWLTPTDSPRERTQPQSEQSTWHNKDAHEQSQNPSKELESQWKPVAPSQASLEHRVGDVYNEEDSTRSPLVGRSLVGSDTTKTNAILSSPTPRTYTNRRESIRFYRDSQRAPKDTLRRSNGKQKEYGESQEEQPARTGDLRPREAHLDVSAEQLDSEKAQKKEQMEARLAQLKADEEAGLFERPPASGGEVQNAERELEIAREDIVARPVEPIPYARYVQIYKASAKRYGFAKDWYVLAAVGKVESNHGENMGPSSAGALGPMQFLPSTWKEYGVDGDKDGVANIMDPEDAIPAAAAYLKAGGAPHDWYMALYTYNHAGWYVREVLGIAEGYRRLAKDDRVQPYV